MYDPKRSRAETRRILRSNHSMDSDMTTLGVGAGCISAALFLALVGVIIKIAIILWVILAFVAEVTVVSKDNCSFDPFLIPSAHCEAPPIQ